MSLRFWKQLSSFRNLSPAKIRAESELPFSLAVAGRPEELAAWQQVLIPPELSERKRDQALKRFFSVAVPVSSAYRAMLPQFHLVLATPAAAEEVRAATRNYILLPAKGLIAYSGTVAVGRGLAQYHRIGRHFTRVEKRQAYHQAFRNGRKLVEEIARKLLRRTVINHPSSVVRDRPSRPVSAG